MAAARPDTSAGALPAPPTPFVGRETELGELAALLATPECRLLTLTGPGGIGKTRLAMEAAARAGGAFALGPRFVALQPLAGPELLLQAIADAAGVSRVGAAEPRERLFGALRERPALLLLDNFEHLVETEGSPLLADLLAAAPGTKVLATSRQALRLQEEWVYPVQGLAYPPEGWGGAPSPAAGVEDFGAVRLFAERVRRGRRDFSLATERDGVVRLCRLVEGMPLALELAAAWAGALTCADVAAEIERGLDVLAGGPRNAPPRHLSVRAAFDGSWDRLAEGQRAVFRRLSVFRGGFRREAAAEVAGAAASDLAALVERSLVRLDADARYRVHELLRQYGETRLREAPEEAVAVEARHGGHFMRWMAGLLPGVLGAGEQEARQSIRADLDNVRAAWRWAVARGDAGALERTAPALAEFYQGEGSYQEGASTFELAAARLDAPATGGPADSPALVIVLSQLGRFYVRLGRLLEAEATLERCLAMAGRLAVAPGPGHGTDPQLSLCQIATIRGDYVRAADLADRALRESETRDHPSNRLFALDLRARVSLHLGHLEAAQRDAERGRALAGSLGYRRAEGAALNVLGSVALVRGDLSRARTHYEANLDLLREIGGGTGTAVGLNKLGQVALRQGDYPAARAAFERSLALGTASGDPGDVTDALVGLGVVATATGDATEARARLRTALAAATGRPFGIYLGGLLVAVGDLALRSGRADEGRMLLALAVRHPAATHDVRSRARRLMGAAGAAGTAEGPGPAPEGPAESSDELVALMLGVLSGLPDAPAGDPTTPGAAPPPGVGDAPRAAGQARAPVEPLTERELEVLRLVAAGLSNREIAGRLVVTVGTAKTHVHNILGKLEAPNRATLGARARDLGLV